MTELEKIQLEIQEDLRKIGLAPDPKPEPGSEPAAETEIQEPAALMIVPEAVPAEDSVPETFYRETIRQSPPVYRHKRKPVSWRKRLAAVCLICTLGTGTLGLGIGAAGAFTEFLWFGGINKAMAVNNPVNTADYAVESTSYIFTNTGDAEATLSDMVELVEPSAVKVSSVFAPAEQQQNPFYPQQEETPNTGSASGIIFSEDAGFVYIATNYHVVGGATTVAINIEGSELIPASPVGSDPGADLAVISVDKAELVKAGVSSIVIANFGDSDLMEVGDTVIAIGNALGEGNIATRGIISATEKVITVENRDLTVLQTDAAINFGNSGGMLLNTRGEVIGINSARLFGYNIEGMGYSISSNIAKPILRDLMNTSSKPSLGIYGNTVPADVAAELNIPPMGVLVASTIPGTGAERAGILKDDIITGFNGESVVTMDVLVDAIAKCDIGDTVAVNVFRLGEMITLNVTLGATVTNTF